MQFSGMDSLDHLTLNSNYLTHMKAGMFEGLPGLKALYIDHNKISTINKDAFKGLEGSFTQIRLENHFTGKQELLLFQLTWSHLL